MSRVFGRLYGPLGQSLATAALGQALLVVSGVVAARALGPHNRGVLALLTLLPMLVGQVASLGLPVAVTYVLASGASRKEALARRMAPIVGVQTAAATLIQLLLVAVLLVPRSPGGFAAVSVASGILTAATLAQSYGLAVLQGERRFTAFNLLRLAPGATYVICVAALAMARSANLTSIAVAWIVANVVVSMATAGAAVRSTTSAQLRTDAVPADPRALIRFGVKASLGSSPPVSAYRLDQLVVGTVLAPASLGLYVAGTAFTNLSRFIGQSIGMVAYPTIAGERDPGRSRRRLRGYFAIGGLLCFALTVGLGVGMSWLLPAFFGRSFASAVGPARLLLVAALFASLRRILADSTRGAGAPLWGTTAELATLIALPAALLAAHLKWGLTGVCGALVLGDGLGLLLLIPSLFHSGATEPVAQAHQHRDVQHLLRSIGPTLRAHVGIEAMVFGSAVALGTCIAFLSLSSERLLATVGIGLAAIGAVVLIASSDVLGWRDMFSPKFGTGVMILLLFVVRPSYVVFGHDDTYLGHNVAKAAPFATLAGAIAVWSFALGYRFRKRTARSGVHIAERRAPLPVGNNRMFIAWLFTLCAVLLFFVNLIAHGGVGPALRVLLAGRSLNSADLAQGSTQYLTAAPILATASALMLIATSNAPRMRAGERVLVAVDVLFPAFAFSLLGQRRFIIAAVGAPLIGWCLRRHRRPPWRLVILVAPVAFLALATIATVRSAGAREQRGGVSGIVGKAIASPATTWRTYALGPDDEMFSAFAVEVDNLHGIDDYALGRASIGDVVLAPFPHALFPGRPETQEDVLLTKLFGGPCKPIGGLCPDVSAVGTFYDDFWLVGVAIGMFLVGLGTSAAYSRYATRPDAIGVVLLASVVIYWPIVLRAGFMPGVLWFLFLALPALLAVKLAMGGSAARMALIPAWVEGV